MQQTGSILLILSQKTAVGYKKEPLYRTTLSLREQELSSLKTEQS